MQTRNIETHARHRREVFWQITLPMILGGGVLLFTCGLTIFTAAGGGVSLWRDISLVWIILPAMVLLLLVLGVVGGLAYGVTRLLQAMPAFFWRLQGYFKLAASRSRMLSDRLMSPLVRGQSLYAGIRSVFKK